MKFYSFTPLTWDEVAMINRAAKKKKKEASSHLYGLEQCSRQKQGKKKKKCLTVLPLECIQYILCVLERRGVCVWVWEACWQEGFQHINITLPHKETQASVGASSSPNKHGSSTVEVRRRANTNGIPQEPALLLTDKWLWVQSCVMWS